MERLSRLDGLRGVLAVYVMIGHATPFTNLPAWATAPFRHGEAAVDLFFALSGLVIVNSLERHGWAAAPFLRARAWRLLPVYWCVLALAVLLIALGSPLPAMPWVAPGSPAAEIGWGTGLPAHFLWHLLAHVVLVHGLIPQPVLPYAWVSLLGPAWSLSTEFQFYALMALAMPRLRNLRRFALLLLGLGVCYHALLLLGPGPFSRSFLPDAAPYFALGLASLALLRDNDMMVFFVALAACCTLGLCSGEMSRGLTPLLWALVIMAQCVHGFPLLPGILDSRALQFLGAISYPLYLLNEPVQRACAMLIAPWAGGNATWCSCAWLPAALTAPVLLAIVLHRTVEQPARGRHGKIAYLPSLPGRFIGRS